MKRRLFEIDIKLLKQLDDPTKTQILENIIDAIDESKLSITEHLETIFDILKDQFISTVKRNCFTDDGANAKIH